MRYFLGIDVGGTKSQGLIVDEAGRAVGFGNAGPGNPTVHGYDGLSRVLEAVARLALDQAGISAAQIAGVGMGVGGYDWPSQRTVTLNALAPIGMLAPGEVVNDAALGIYAGTREGWGVAVGSGTSCNCRGRNRAGREGRVTGYGIDMGEGAGAYEIYRMALRAVALAWTRRAPPTQLTQALMEFLGAPDPDQLMELITTGRYKLFESAMGPLVFGVAAAGDPVAKEIILWAGRELASMVKGVVRQIDLQGEAFDVVMFGSSFNGSPLLVETMQQEVLIEAPRASFVRLTAPPVVGAALLGMEQVGLHPYGLRARVIETTLELIEQGKPDEKR